MPSLRGVHAIIGCGRVAPNHVDGFSALDGWELRWACDRDFRIAQDFARRHGLPRAAASIEEVLADPDLTSVSIAVDHGQHARLAEQALLAGKHVLVEKPLALSPLDGERLVGCAAQRELVLSVVSQHRYDPLVLAVRNWLCEGLLGSLLYAQVSLEAGREVTYYTSSYWRGSRLGEGGSALINQGYHCLDITRFLCGELQVRAAVAGRRALEGVIETEDTISALLLAGAMPVTLNVTVGSSTTWRTRIELVGTLGTVSFDLDHPGALHRVTGNATLRQRAEMERLRSQTEEPPGIDYYGVSHRRQIADFAAAVCDGVPLASDVQSALTMIELLQDIYRAAGEPPAAPTICCADSPNIPDGQRRQDRVAMIHACPEPGAASRNWEDPAGSR